LSVLTKELSVLTKEFAELLGEQLKRHTDGRSDPLSGSSAEASTGRDSLLY
jgi:hypothetical protein